MVCFVCVQEKRLLETVVSFTHTKHLFDRGKSDFFFGGDRGGLYIVLLFQVS